MGHHGRFRGPLRCAARLGRLLGPVLLLCAGPGAALGEASGAATPVSIPAALLRLPPAPTSGDEARVAALLAEAEAALLDDPAAALAHLQQAAAAAAPARAQALNDRIEALAGADPPWVVRTLLAAERLEPAQAAALPDWEAGLQRARTLAAKDPAAALPLARALRRRAELDFGAGHALTLLALEEVAVLQFRLGRSGAAAAALEAAVQRAVPLFGSGHPQTQRYRGLLADLEDARGRHEAALALREAIDAAWTQADPALGRQHPEALRARRKALDTLGALGRHRGAAEQAVDLCVDVHARYGAVHPRTGSCLLRLGDALAAAGDPQAEAVYDGVAAFAARQAPTATALGLRALAGAAEQLRRSGRLEAALERLRAVPVGPETPAPSPAQLAVLETRYRIQTDRGAVGQARELATAVHRARAALGGPDDPGTLAALAVLADARAAAGDLRGARAAAAQALETSQRHAGAEAPQTLALTASLARIEAGLGDTAGADARLAAALRGATPATLARPAVLEVLATRIALRAAAGDHGAAMALQQQAVEALVAVRGSEATASLAARQRLAELSWAAGDVPAATGLLVDVLADLRRIQGEDHPDTLAALRVLGRLQLASGSLDAADRALGAVLAARETALGARHPEVLRARLDSAEVQLARGGHREAERALRATVRDCEDQLGEAHPYTLAALDGLARAHEAQGEARRALRVRTQALRRGRTLLLLQLRAAPPATRDRILASRSTVLDAYLAGLAAVAPADAGEALLAVSQQYKGLLPRLLAEARHGAAPSRQRDWRALGDARRERLAVTVSTVLDADLRRRRLAELDARIAALEARTADGFLVDPGGDLEAAVPALASGTLLVDFLFYEGAGGRHLLAAAVVGGAARRRVAFVDYGLAAPLIADGGALVAALRQGDQTQALGLGRRLWDRLWAPLVALAPASSDVRLVPDGPLHGLPFAALVTPEGHFLDAASTLGRLRSSAVPRLPADGPRDGTATVGAAKLAVLRTDPGQHATDSGSVLADAVAALPWHPEPASALLVLWPVSDDVRQAFTDDLEVRRRVEGATAVAATAARRALRRGAGGRRSGDWAAFTVVEGR